MTEPTESKPTNFDVTTVPALCAQTEDFDYTVAPFFRASKELLARGIKCIPIPCQEKGCRLKDWPELATTDLVQIEKWKHQNPRMNAGAVASPEGVCILDIDDPSIIEQMPAGMPRTFTVKSSKGLHFYFKQTDATRALGNASASAPDNPEHHFFDFQQNRKYVVAPWSIHPTGAMYSVVDDSPVLECPDWLTSWISKIAQESSLTGTETETKSVPNQLVLNGKVIGEFSPVSQEQFENWLDLHKEDVLAGEYKKASGGTPARWQYIRAERCPWESEHTQKNGDKDFAVYIVAEGPKVGQPGIRCMHSHKKTWSDYRNFLTARTGHNFNMHTGEIQVFKEPTITITDEFKETNELAVSDMPDGVLDGRLGDITKKRMSRFPIAFSWPSIVTMAGTVIDRIVTPTGAKCFIDNSPRTNIYAGLVAGIGVGKSSTTDQSALVLGVEPPTLITGNVGSGEGLIEMLGDASGSSRLWNPDELSRVLVKANIEQSVLSHVLTTAFYKDQDAHTVKGRSIYFNARVSLIGGIVEDQFGTAFSNKSFGGLYDRFTFGIAPTGYKYDWYPLDQTKEKYEAKPVYVDNDVYDRVAEWKKQHPDASPRIAEIALRFAYIAACYSGKKLLTAKDMDAAFVFAEYQRNARLLLKPNGGETYAAKMAESIRMYLIRHKGWIKESTLKDGISMYRVGEHDFVHSPAPILTNCSGTSIDLKRFGLRPSSAVLICIFSLPIGTLVSFPVHGYCDLVAID